MIASGPGRQRAARPNQQAPIFCSNPHHDGGAHLPRERPALLLLSLAPLNIHQLDAQWYRRSSDCIAFRLFERVASRPRSSTRACANRQLPQAILRAPWPSCKNSGSNLHGLRSPGSNLHDRPIVNVSSRRSMVQHTTHPAPKLLPPNKSRPIWSDKWFAFRSFGSRGTSTSAFSKPPVHAAAGDEQAGGQGQPILDHASSIHDHRI